MLTWGEFPRVGRGGKRRGRRRRASVDVVDTTPILDLAALAQLRALADDVARPGEDVLGRLLQIFVEDSAARLVTLQAAWTAGDAAAAARAAHNLKGAAANMGALRVVAAAVVVEAACRAPPAGAASDSDLAAGVATLAAALDEASQELRRSFGQRE